MGECDIDDILCQLNVLRDLRSLKSNLGDERFAERFPEFEGMEEKLEVEIGATRDELETAIAKCGNIEEIPIEEATEEE